MGSSLHLLLAFGALAFFMLMLFFSTSDFNQTYIKSVLLVYPLLSIDLTPGYVSMSIFVFISAVFVLFFYQHRSLDYTGKRIFSFLIGCFFLVVLLGLLFADDYSRDSITSCAELISIFIFSKVLIEECIHDTKFYAKVKNYLRVTVWVALVFLVAQIYVGPSFSIAKTQNINVISGVKIRYTSFFQDPQKFAQFLAACSFLFLFPREEAVGGKINKNILLFLATVTAILFTGGRSALGGWLIAMTAIIMCSNARFRIAFISLLALLLSVAYFYAESFALFQRESTVADAYAFRYEIWKDALGIFAEYPLLGIGSGNYANYVSLHHPDQFWIADNEVTYFDHPESGYLKLLVEYGILGSLCLFLFLLVPGLRMFRLYLRTRQTSFVLPLASILSWMVGFYTVYSLGDIRIFVLVATFISMLIVDYEINSAVTPHSKSIQTA